MFYPSSAWERIMKIQDVFEKANRKTLTWREAAEICYKPPQKTAAEKPVSMVCPPQPGLRS